MASDLQCAGLAEVLAQVFEGLPPGQGVSACAARVVRGLLKNIRIYPYETM